MNSPEGNRSKDGKKSKKESKNSLDPYRHEKSPPYTSANSSDDFNGTPPTSEEVTEQSGEDADWQVGEQVFAGEDYVQTGYTEPCKSETDETPQSSSQENSNSESQSSSEALSNVYAKFSPFIIQWSFGVDINVELINLTTSEAFEVFFVASHFGVIYNYKDNTMTFLPGHNSSIKTISADTSGRWLVTSDAGEDTVIIVWDSRKKIPVWTLYNVFPGEGVSQVRISQDARFLAAVNCKPPYVLKFWLWTYGQEKPDGSMNIDQTHGKVKHIDFNHASTEQFAVTLELGVEFCEWEKQSKTIKSNASELKTRKKNMGTLRETIFLDDNHTAITSTSQGYVVVWCDVAFNEPIIEDEPGTIEKHHLKTVRIHNSGITSLRLCDRMIASSSEEGVIFFHDQYLRLMFCFPNRTLGPVVSISFNVDNIPCSADPFSSAQPPDSPPVDEEVENIFEYDSYDADQDVRNYGEALEVKESKKLVVKEKTSCDRPYPNDCTIEKKEFVIRDFVFLTSFGRIGYMSHKRQKLKYYLHPAESTVVSMDCNPTKPHLVIGYSNGKLALIEYNQKKRLLSVTFSKGITALKYSTLGHCLMAGLQNGDIYELDSLLLTVKTKMETLKGAIEKICFSKFDDLFACYDQNSIVQVFRKKQASEAWISMGRYKSHYKPIVDIMFDENPENRKVNRLFTIGEDRMLVEYDVKNIEDTKLKILSVFRIEQSAIPRCFTSLHNLHKSPYFIVSNNQYKLKLLDMKTYVCKKTTVGPTADTPINFIKIIQDFGRAARKFKMVYTTQKHIGLGMLPFTGNPFESIGMIAHPEKITSIALSHDYQYFFTVGINDVCPLMWEINCGSVEVASQLGGVGIEPFVALVEGGANSFLFKEMEDFFYYSQIIHQGEDPNLDRSVSKNLALCEIPDFFRSLGFFPTEYEIQNLLHELQYWDVEDPKVPRSEVTFDECVKAYLNHRPVQGITLTDIQNALMTIADVRDPTDIIIERNDLLKVLEEEAEGMDPDEVYGYLCILLFPKDEANPIPQYIRLNDFAEVVYGIDLSITEENVREITHAFETKFS